MKTIFFVLLMHKQRHDHNIPSKCKIMCTFSCDREWCDKNVNKTRTFKPFSHFTQLSVDDYCFRIFQSLNKFRTLFLQQKHSRVDISGEKMCFWVPDLFTLKCCAAESLFYSTPLPITQNSCKK